MKSNKKINIIISLIAIIIMAITAPGKPSDFGHSDNPSFYKVKKFVVCSVCYEGYYTDGIYKAMGYERWEPCGFGILGMTFDI